MSIKQFIRNIGYLFRFSIKEIKKSLLTETEVFVILDNFKYELVNDSLKSLPVPKILSHKDTVDILISSNKSISRFGDAEFLLINGTSLPYQECDEKLVLRLREILQSDNENNMIGINYCYFNYSEDMSGDIKYIFRDWMPIHRKAILENIDMKKQYYDAGFTQLYLLYHNIDFENYFESVKRIWSDKNITIICGQTVFDTIENNIFDNAKSVEYYYAPPRNAFSEYDTILKNTLKIDIDRLIIIILGATATVLAYDLSKHGYRALDLGHIAKDYDYYMKKIKHSPSTMYAFFQPD